ncbi:MAG: ATP-dependent helicase, partial [Patescibacteria group bacterium]
MDLLKTLNKEQLKAVTHENGPLLIVAGAGTGKTTVLINRLAYLVLDKKINTENILLLTFTEKAAGELEERADKILPYGYVDLWIHTFHGFCERILRENALDIGLSASFKLVNDTEQWILIKKNLELFELDYYRPLGNPTKFISEMLRHFSRLKDENISVEEYWQYTHDLENGKITKGDGNKDKIKKSAKAKTIKKNEDDSEDGEDDELEIVRIKELANAYKVYNQLLLDNNFLDFGDLIVYTLKLWNSRPNILKKYQQQFKYIMVDEFQDTNLAQYELVKILAKSSNNLVVVGDDDQAVYKFRGASISNIMQFKDDYQKAPEIVLTENYRSRQEILDRAYQFIQNNNPNRLEEKLKIDKKLIAKSYNEKSQKTLPEIVQFFNFGTQDEELSSVSEKIISLYEAGQGKIKYSDFAILVRANDTADIYVKELTRRNIPNQFMSWRGLYYKPLILDILAYFRLLDNYHESSALFRVLNMDIFKVSHLDLININKVANRKVWSLFEALKNINQVPGISDKSIKNINKLLALVETHSVLAAKERPTKILLNFAYDSGLLKNLDIDKDLETFSYLNQLYQKIRKLEEAEPDLKLKEFLEAINLELEAGETGNLKLDFLDSEAVKIMTVHGAKGLEFKYVFIVNLVDKKFPTINRGEKISIPEKLVKEIISDSSGADIHLEEERRLFYVAMTRAKEGLYLSGAKDYGGVREKKPSRFIEEAGLTPIESENLKLSAKNEFLRDLHRLNAKEIVNEKVENYPLPDKFSFSQLAAYSSCPLQYKFAFILKVPVLGDKASLIFGRVLHNTLYNFFLPLLDKQIKKQGDLFGGINDSKKKPAEDPISLKRLLEIYNEFWQEDGYKSKKEREEYKQKGLKAVNDYWDTYQKTAEPLVLFLEKKFYFRIG